MRNSIHWGAKYDFIAKLSACGNHWHAFFADAAAAQVAPLIANISAPHHQPGRSMASER
jgi:hypothetical protein